jgi:hypothetical protein
VAPQVLVAIRPAGEFLTTAPRSTPTPHYSNPRPLSRISIFGAAVALPCCGRSGMGWREFAEVVVLLAVFAATGLLLGFLVTGTAP